MNYHPGIHVTSMYPGEAVRECFNFEAPSSTYITLLTMPNDETGQGSRFMVIDAIDMRYNTPESATHYVSLWVVADGDNPASSGTRITDRVRVDDAEYTLLDFEIQTNSNGFYPTLAAGESLVAKFETEDAVSGSSSGEGDGPWTLAATGELADLTIGVFRRSMLG